jgi:hypothetical protein
MTQEVYTDYECKKEIENLLNLIKEMIKDDPKIKDVFLEKYPEKEEHFLRFFG